MSSLKTELYKWRDAEAARRGIESFRILTNTALDAIAMNKPVAKQDFLAIKGIKDAKYAEYGKTLTGMVLAYGGGLFAEDDGMTESRKSLIYGDETKEAFPFPAGDEPSSVDAPEPLSVSVYLDRVNDLLDRSAARVIGEVSSVQSRGRALYFGIKDPKDGSALSVFMWESDYVLSGVTLEEGLEVVIEGESEVYKPTGRLSFRARTLAYVGEGALKKAYDALKKKLDTEGLFAAERKRPIPDFPETIGLITSRQGAVIHDFQSNLGRYGYKVRFRDSRVEGALAVKDLLAALDEFRGEDIDVLVIIRGGGSLESLQAFNNEAVARAVASFPAPTLIAIGHDKDVPLVDLVADVSPSTPTACATVLNRSWQEAEKDLRISGMRMMETYEVVLRNSIMDTDHARDRLTKFLNDVQESVFLVDRGLREALGKMETTFVSLGHSIRHRESAIVDKMMQILRDNTTRLREYEKRLASLDPMRQLRLGYSVLLAEGKVLRSVHEINIGDDFEARVADGTIIGIVNKKSS